jgi:hypothetical protein
VPQPTGMNLGSNLAGAAPSATAPESAEAPEDRHKWFVVDYAKATNRKFLIPALILGVLLVSALILVLYGVRPRRVAGSPE